MKNRLIDCLSILSGTRAARVMKQIKQRLPGSVALLPSVLIILMMGVSTGCQEPELTKNENLDSPTKKASLNKEPEFPAASDFVSEITNPFLAFKTGRIFYYESETDEGLETIIVEVTTDNKVIMGNIMATVVRDQEFLDGELVEDTFDWFAQDKDGNVWYLGEDTKEYEDGEVVSTEGSWEAGVQGALPGLIMAANPINGMKYRQEFFEGEAEDHAIVINTNKTVTIGLGTFEGCLETMEFSAIEPGHREHKYYHPGTGLLLEWSRSGGGKAELVKIEN